MTFTELKEAARPDWERFLCRDRSRVLVGGATCGHAAGATAVLTAFRSELAKRGLTETVGLFESGCLGMCHAEPVVEVKQQGGPALLYVGVTAEFAAELVLRHLVSGEPIAERVVAVMDGASVAGVPQFAELPMIKHQVRIILRNCGIIDPTNINHYVARGGYAGLERTLAMTPEAAIAEIQASGLRGRGGAGFPTGLKWSFAKQTPARPKYVICNADEGDPGAFMNRSLLEGDPHAMLEGLMIAGYAVGADVGYVYCRAEYPLAIKHLELALEQMKAKGLLGRDIMGSGFGFEIKIKQGAGAFVCGEETALMASLSGQRGMPRPKPPFPAVAGLFGKPTNINNVETLAAAAAIMAKGAAWYAGFGTDKSKGTKTFALVGKIKNPGLIEVPLGIPLGTIIHDVGGGILGDKKLKAVQTGGPSGGCIPASRLDLPIDYERLAEVGSIMGSGGMIVIDEDSCMVDVARYFLGFTESESCGKCTPCRMGTQHLLRILTEICAGRGEPGMIEQMRRIGDTMKQASLCGLGQTAGNPVATTLRYFEHEYQAHIHDRHCPAGVCRGLYAPSCQRSCPVGQDVPTYNALIGENRFQEALEVIREDNPFPGVCGRMCAHACEKNCVQLETASPPLSIRSLKRFAVDHERLHGAPNVTATPLRHPEKIAVVGAGPAGLTAARDLRREGYPVTVFESAARAGGMLRLAVPDYRMPAAALDRDLEAILASGVELRTGVNVGRDPSLEALRAQGYQAILIATGAHRCVPSKLPGAQGEGVLQALEFLKATKAGKGPQLKGEVLVVGSTHAALDAARTAIRLGAARVGLVYPRPAEQLPFEPDEIEAAREEGVVIHDCHEPLEVVRAGGLVSGLKCRRLAPRPADQTGRARSLPGAGDEVVLRADGVIFGLGQEVELSAFGAGPAPRKSRWSGLEVTPISLETDLPGVFAAGDCVSGGATVIEAIAMGQKAAAVIHRRLRGLPLLEPFKLVKPRGQVKLGEAPVGEEDFQRPGQSRRPAGERTRDFAEVDATFTEALAVCEARRCLRCGLPMSSENREDR